MEEFRTLSKDELLQELERLTKSIKNKRFGLMWQEIPEQFDIESEEKLPVIEEVAELSIRSDDSKPTNILIEGDNYHALTCLSYTHKEKIDVIYIDPPYNTGTDGFIYKDKRISDKYPDGTLVPKNHPYRHSYWLSFMRKRLELAQKLLKPDGVIFISIGNDEIAQLKLLCDQIFGVNDFNNIIHWKKNQKPQNASQTISESAEFVLVYFNRKPVKLVRPMYGTRADEGGSFKPAPMFKFDGRPRRVQVIPAGTAVEAKSWRKGRIAGARNRLAYIDVLDDPVIEEGILKNDVRVDGQWSKTETNGKYQEVVEEGRLFINSNGFPNEKAYRTEDSRNVHTNLWTEAGYNELGKALLDNILGEDNVFSYPKPVELVKEILRSVNKPHAIVLDFFAGSGTTGHAVMMMNEEEPGSKRQFIMVTNNEGQIMEKVCYPRTKKAIEGYSFTGKQTQKLYEKKLSFTALKNIDQALAAVEEIEQDQAGSWDKLETKVLDGKLTVIGTKNVKENVDGLGGSVKYYKTNFVGQNNINNVNDADWLDLAKKANDLIALAEDTLYAVEANEYFAIYSGKDTHTAIYFREELAQYSSFLQSLAKLETPISAYVFSWGNVADNEDLAALPNLTLKVIPKPILEIYKSIYNLEVL